jgi:plasmid stability protein
LTIIEGDSRMPDILIRGLEPETIRELKTRAKRNGRSLQSEAKMLIEQATGSGSRDITAMFDRWQKRFAGRKFSSSAQLIRKDRDR